MFRGHSSPSRRSRMLTAIQSERSEGGLFQAAIRVDPCPKSPRPSASSVSSSLTRREGWPDLIRQPRLTCLNFKGGPSRATRPNGCLIPQTNKGLCRIKFREI